MNAIRRMYDPAYTIEVKTERTALQVVNNKRHNDEYVNVNGKAMTKHELNEKLAYFYEHGGPVMDI